MSDKSTSYTELNCRLELYGRMDDGDGDVVLSDLESPHYAPKQAADLYDWIAVELCNVMSGLSQEERRSIHGTVHLRAFTNKMGASHIIPPRLSRVIGKLGLDLHCVYYATCPPDARQ